ncbi:MAG: isoprenylcysteine carboxylmethyltransferase family protein [Xanthobacteraceae bacterium]
MTTYDWIIAACWLVFVAVWAVMGVRATRPIGARNWRREGWLRIAAAALLLLGLYLPPVRHAIHGLRATVAGAGLLVGPLGAALCALGIGLAIWARLYLGRNWGLPMSRQADAELVTGGPYAYVRHPIYSGMLVAMLGSALGNSPFWLAALVPFGIYFVTSARREEKLMLEQFPQQYRDYMARTKMLVPFLV